MTAPPGALFADKKIHLKLLHLMWLLKIDISLLMSLVPAKYLGTNKSG